MSQYFFSLPSSGLLCCSFRSSLTTFRASYWFTFSDFSIYALIRCLSCDRAWRWGSGSSLINTSELLALDRSST